MLNEWYYTGDTSGADSNYTVDDTDPEEVSGETNNAFVNHPGLFVVLLALIVSNIHWNIHNLINV